MNIKTVILFLIYGIFLSSCSTTDIISLNIKEKATVNIPADIKKIGIVNRNGIKNNNLISGLDSILFTQERYFDQYGGQKVIQGLCDELKKNTQLSDVKKIHLTDIKKCKLNKFPPEISWDMVERICNEKNVDVIFVLSFYKTKIEIVDYKQINIIFDHPKNGQISGIEHHITISASFKAGIRIYDPKKSLLRDEHITQEEIILKGHALSIRQAVSNAIQKIKKNLTINYNIGKHYVLRLVRYPLIVKRLYYTRGNNDFRKACKKVKHGDWDAASNSWKQYTTDQDKKIAGRACYNMALYHEIKGNLKKAADWAFKAYTDYQDKYSLDYFNQLKLKYEKR